MTPTDPPAADLGAQWAQDADDRRRLLETAERLDAAGIASMPVQLSTIRALYVWLDAQAARLAAMTTLMQGWIAACCGDQAGLRFCESFGCSSLLEILDAGAAGAGEARDDD